MINRPLDLIPHQRLIDELVRLYRLDPHWVDLECRPGVEGFTCRLKHATWMERSMRRGNDYMSALALSTWVGSGPKIFRPTEAQCEALEQIEVKLNMVDYAQPYPALLVDLPAERYGTFSSTVVYHWPERNAMALYSARAAADDRADMMTVVPAYQPTIEDALQKYEEDCATMGPVAVLATRVAVNACLALVNYGAQHAALFPKELANDRHYAREQTPRGERARQRVALAPQLVTFNQEVTLHRQATRHGTASGGPTGRQMPPGFRRGHWRMQPYGPRYSLRRRQLIKPCLVRADLFVGDLANTTTTYR